MSPFKKLLFSTVLNDKVMQNLHLPALPPADAEPPRPRVIIAVDYGQQPVTSHIAAIGGSQHG